MNPGESDGLSPAELKERFPEEIAKVRENPYRHRYPRAEVSEIIHKDEIILIKKIMHFYYVFSRTMI